MLLAPNEKPLDGAWAGAPKLKAPDDFFEGGSSLLCAGVEPNPFPKRGCFAAGLPNAEVPLAPKLVPELPKGTTGAAGAAAGAEPKVAVLFEVKFEPNGLDNVDDCPNKGVCVCCGGCCGCCCDCCKGDEKLPNAGSVGAATALFGAADAADPKRLLPADSFAFSVLLAPPKTKGVAACAGAAVGIELLDPKLKRPLVVDETFPKDGVAAVVAVSAGLFPEPN